MEKHAELLTKESLSTLKPLKTRQPSIDKRRQKTLIILSKAIEMPSNKASSTYRPREFKRVVIDNARFLSTKNIQLPDNIYLLNIPPYTPELNPCEQVWAHSKTRFKNQGFKTMQDLKDWVYDTIQNMSEQTIMSITANHHYLNDLIRLLKVKLV